MHDAVVGRASDMDVVVMAAAVADYAPVVHASEKLPKDAESLTLVLKKTPDILAELGRRRVSSGLGPVLVGFAAETDHLVSRAAAKREAKHVDFIIANDVSQPGAGFDSVTNQVTIIGPNGVEALPLQSKARVAMAILDRVESLLASWTATSSSNT